MKVEDLLTVEQAAEELGIQPGTLRNAMTEGRIPVVRVFSRRLLTREAIEEYRNRTQPDGTILRGRPRKKGSAE